MDGTHPTQAPLLLVEIHIRELPSSFTKVAPEEELEEEVPVEVEADEALEEVTLNRRTLRQLQESRRPLLSRYVFYHHFVPFSAWYRGCFRQQRCFVTMTKNVF